MTWPFPAFPDLCATLSHPAFAIYFSKQKTVILCPMLFVGGMIVWEKAPSASLQLYVLRWKYGEVSSSLAKMMLQFWGHNTLLKCI